MVEGEGKKKAMKQDEEDELNDSDSYCNDGDCYRNNNNNGNRKVTKIQIWFFNNVF